MFAELSGAGLQSAFLQLILRPVNENAFFKPYKLSSEQVAKIIKEVLTGNIDRRNWDNFICIPINGNADMGKIRVKCKALSDQETIERCSKIRYSKLAQLELHNILKELQISVTSIE